MITSITPRQPNSWIWGLAGLSALAGILLFAKALDPSQAASEARLHSILTTGQNTTVRLYGYAIFLSCLGGLCPLYSSAIKRDWLSVAVVGLVILVGIAGGFSISYPRLCSNQSWQFAVSGLVIAAVIGLLALFSRPAWSKR